MDKIVLELPVISVKVLKDSTDGWPAREYSGVSWCDAVRLATFGEELLVVPGSIEICKWSPIILGLKEPENPFEESLQPRLEQPVAGVYVAPLSRFDSAPDVVIVRGRPGQLRDLARRLGEGSLSTTYRGQIGKTAIGVGERGLSARVMLSHVSNRALAVMKHWKRFDDLTRVAFKDYRVTGLFEKVARNAVADMSMCRNSTVLPLVEDAGNISFFCVGGVSWGGNSPVNMTSGYPGRMAGDILEHVDFPGKKL
ncbi:MAG: hypothetical protein ACYC99_09945 [Candidatus Geothermincolia bacterium]